MEMIGGILRKIVWSYDSQFMSGLQGEVNELWFFSSVSVWLYTASHWFIAYLVMSISMDYAGGEHDCIIFLEPSTSSIRLLLGLMTFFFIVVRFT
jgi:hypothetical protein